jgi:hypothetical protein
MSGWFGFWAPKGTPKDVVAKLNGAMMQVLADPTTQAKFAELGLDVASKEQQTPKGPLRSRRPRSRSWWPSHQGRQHQGRMTGQWKKLLTCDRRAAAVRHRRRRACADLSDAPITLVVPFTAGGPTDTIAARLPERLRVSLRPDRLGREHDRGGRHHRPSARSCAPRPMATRF